MTTSMATAVTTMATTTTTTTTTTELEDQLTAMFHSEIAYAPVTCALRSSPLDYAATDKRGVGGGKNNADTPLTPPPVSPTSSLAESESLSRSSSHHRHQHQQQHDHRHHHRGGQQHRNAASAAPPLIPHNEWRARIADWSYRVVDHFRYDREVVSVSMNFFDRFLVLTRAEKEEKLERHDDDDDDNEVVDSRTYQLAAMTALFLSVKIHGEQPEEEDDDDDDEEDRDDEFGRRRSRPSSSSSSSSYGSDRKTSSHYDRVEKADPTSRHRGQKHLHQDHRRSGRGVAAPPKRRRLRLTSFVELSRGQFSSTDISSMERRMLSTLRWRVNPPTPMAFVSYLLRLFPASPPPRAVVVVVVVLLFFIVLEGDQ